MTVFAGQTLKSGHFLQPTVRATGQSVIPDSFFAFLWLIVRAVFDPTGRVVS